MIKKSILFSFVLTGFFIINSCADNKETKKTGRAKIQQMAENGLKASICLVEKDKDLPNTAKQALISNFKAKAFEEIDKKAAKFLENCSEQEINQGLTFAKCLNNGCQNANPGFNFADKFQELIKDCHPKQELSKKCEEANESLFPGK